MISLFSLSTLYKLIIIIIIIILRKQKNSRENIRTGNLIDNLLSGECFPWRMFLFHDKGKGADPETLKSWGGSQWDKEVLVDRLNVAKSQGNIS